MIRIFRFITTTLVISFFVSGFLVSGVISDRIISRLSEIQFFPSLILILSKNPSILTVLCFILIIILTLLFGRIYCSVMCPFGILQDFIIFIRGRFRKYRNKYNPSLDFIKYPVLIITVMLLIFSNITLVNILEPYSIFGRIINGVAFPIVAGINNFSAGFLSDFKIYFVKFIDTNKITLITALIGFSYLSATIVASVFKGRIFCSTLCPTGIILGLLSRFSFYKISLDNKSCSKCGLCEKICPTSSIAVKEGFVDSATCVMCFECIGTCKFKAINYTKTVKINNSIKKDRRYFLERFLKYAGGIVVASLVPVKLASHTKIIKKIIRPIPPGSLNIENLRKNCTGCWLCVQKCPKNIIKPVFDKDKRIFQVELDFNKSFCDYECSLCSQICPTNAISPVSLENKKTIQIGIVKFIKTNCIVYTQETDCAACSEHCPTKAVYTVPYKENLLIPETDIALCIGCGACQYACPAVPDKAIIVEGATPHGRARKVEKSIVRPNKAENNDFPF